MCLVLLANDVHPRYRLVLAANRDEFFRRRTAPANRWADAPDVLAGRDLEGGGTWLGVTIAGRWAAVTNFRESAPPLPDAPSRGHLVAEYLRGREAPSEYADRLTSTAASYNGFNLLLGDAEDVCWISNRTAEGAGISRRRLGAGLYGISNHLLDTPWRKVTRGKERLKEIAAAETDPSADSLLEMLLDTTFAAEHELPRTGVSRDLEIALSAAFISTPDYGTRSSSALLIGRDGGIHLAERSFDSSARVVEELHHHLDPREATLASSTHV
jgi:uncharacterized protein with NRDE domain